MKLQGGRDGRGRRTSLTSEIVSIRSCTRWSVAARRKSSPSSTSSTLESSTRACCKAFRIFSSAVFRPSSPRPSPLFRASTIVTLEKLRPYMIYPNKPANHRLKLMDATNQLFPPLLPERRVPKPAPEDNPDPFRITF